VRYLNRVDAMSFTRSEIREILAWDGPLLPLEPIDHAHLIEHGTDRGYQQHRRYGVDVCDECRAAHRDSRRAERARRSAA